MLKHLENKARRSARRALFAALCGVSAAIGAGFGSASLYAALLEAGQTHAMAGLILSCLWFGLSGLFLLLKSAVGATTGHSTAAPELSTPHLAHPNGHAATAPSVADAFVAGMNEGAGFARAQRRAG